MKVKKILLSILAFIGILSLVYSGGRADEPPKYFWDRQIHLIKTYRIDERTYSLAIEVSGFAEKLIFIQLYDFDITGVLNTETEYISPVFKDLVIDWKIDKETGEEINNPDAEHRGTMLNVSHCMFYKVVAVGFNTLCYDAERSRGTAGIKPSARISLKIISYDYIPEQNKIIIKFGDGSLQELNVTLPKPPILIQRPYTFS